ncbi:hypothetical protein [Treponema phagedenis]|uniref:hypothetical protein n=1 Tax=Treponema phagedenis TaxID=162 RepID=UPI0011E896DA|nr:hypothetical protein [Treponema phagedenis]NVP23005.1 hypothetical protein [Treponema phagedenis]QEK02133.1 hypothetical protein FUT84_13845 [Treponema phagedenis]QEK07392.1 hypothetical protein FUT80_12115 [Treponema phagedenis]QLC57885.1 hypothetical protein HW453_02965 [Treponema phagedenis]
MQKRGLLGYLEVLRQTLENYGLPAALYPDKCSVFFVNAKKQLSIEEQLQGTKEHNSAKLSST